MLAAGTRGATRAIGRVNIQRSRLHTGHTEPPDQTEKGNAIVQKETIPLKPVSPKSSMSPKWNVPHDKQNWRFWEDVQKEREEEERRERERNREKEEEREEEENEREEEEKGREEEKNEERKKRPKQEPFTDKDIQNLINRVSNALDQKDEHDKQHAAKESREHAAHVRRWRKWQSELPERTPVHE